MLLLLLLFSVAIICLYFILNSHFDYWKKRGVPHPPVSKLFGNIGPHLVLKQSLGQIYDEIYNKYPSLLYVGFYKIRTPGIVIRDPELVKDVLIKNFNSFHVNDFEVNEKLDPLVAKNPFFSRGEQWKTTRNQLAPSFTSKQVKSMFPMINAVCKKLITYLEEADPSENCFDAKELCSKFTTDVAASCAFGLEANSFVDPNAVFRQMGKKILTPSFWVGFKLMIRLVMPSLGNFLHIKLINNDADSYFRNIVTQTLEYRQKRDVVRNDFLDVLNEYKKKLGEDVFSDEDITAHALGFFLDGSETSSTAFSFALYELGANPDIQDKLRQEVNTELAQNGGEFNYDMVNEMSYLDKFINETFRKHPPGVSLNKICTSPCELPSADGKGPHVTIEPGTSIVLPVYSLHYDSKYFPDPDRFDPERFSEGGRENIVKGAYLPFGDGPRICLGQRFGIVQVKTGLVNVISKFEIRVNNKTKTPLKMDPTYHMLAAEGGLWLSFRKI